MRHEYKLSLEEMSIPEPNTGCWLWLGYVNKKGYGRNSSVVDKITPGGTYLAHRRAWIEMRGPIPAGLLVLHKCDQPSCVNPDHLFIGTHKENSDDKIRKGRDRHPGQAGDLHPNVVLSDQQVRDIRARRAAGEKVVAIAADYPQVGIPCVRSIANGYRRKSVQPMQGEAHETDRLRHHQAGNAGRCIAGCQPVAGAD